MERIIGRATRETTAGALEVGDYVVETRGSASYRERVALAVVAVEKDRFVHFTLSDGSERVLSAYVEVEVLDEKPEGVEASQDLAAWRLFTRNPAMTSVEFEGGRVVTRADLQARGLML